MNANRYTFTDPKTHEERGDTRTLDEIYEALVKLDSDFAHSLAESHACNKRGLSPKQTVWAYKLVMDSETPAAPATNSEIDGSPIVALFATASNHLKYPKVDFTVDLDPNRVVNRLLVRFARVNSGPNEGCVNITNGLKYGHPDNIYYGKVLTDGRVKLSLGAHPHPQVADLIEAFTHDPVDTISRFGLTRGACCICDKGLTDDRSKAAGYGPVCAKNWGLPWGDKVVVDGATRNLMPETTHCECGEHVPTADLDDGTHRCYAIAGEEHHARMMES